MVNEEPESSATVPEFLKCILPKMRRAGMARTKMESVVGWVVVGGGGGSFSRKLKTIPIVDAWGDLHDVCIH